MSKVKRDLSEQILFIFFIYQYYVQASYLLLSHVSLTVTLMSLPSFSPITSSFSGRPAKASIAFRNAKHRIGGPVSRQ